MLQIFKESIILPNHLFTLYIIIHLVSDKW